MFSGNINITEMSICTISLHKRSLFVQEEKVISNYILDIAKVHKLYLRCRDYSYVLTIFLI